MSTCVETFATLRVFSDSLSPAAIAEALQMAATYAAARDHESSYRPGRDAHCWSWSTQGMLASADNQEHIWLLLTAFSKKREALARLRQQGCEIDLCNYYVSVGQGGPALDVLTTLELGRLELPIWWDV